MEQTTRAREPAERRARSPRRRGQSGFGTMEAAIALSILTAALLGLAASGSFAQRQVTKAHQRAGSMGEARSQIEELLAAPYDSLANGSNEVAGVRMDWTVTDLGNNKRIVLVYRYHTSGRERVDTVVAGARSR